MRREDTREYALSSGAFPASVKLGGTRLPLLSQDARECKASASFSPYFFLFTLFSLKKRRLGHAALVRGV